MAFVSGQVLFNSSFGRWSRLLSENAIITNGQINRPLPVAAIGPIDAAIIVPGHYLHLDHLL